MTGVRFGIERKRSQGKDRRPAVRPLPLREWTPDARADLFHLLESRRRAGQLQRWTEGTDDHLTHVLEGGSADVHPNSTQQRVGMGAYEDGPDLRICVFDEGSPFRQSSLGEVDKAWFTANLEETRAALREARRPTREPEDEFETDNPLLSVAPDRVRAADLVGAFEGLTGAERGQLTAILARAVKYGDYVLAGGARRLVAVPTEVVGELPGSIQALNRFERSREVHDRAVFVRVGRREGWLYVRVEDPAEGTGEPDWYRLELDCMDPREPLTAPVERVLRRELVQVLRRSPSDFSRLEPQRQLELATHVLGEIKTGRKGPSDADKLEVRVAYAFEQPIQAPQGLRVALTDNLGQLGVHAVDRYGTEGHWTFYSTASTLKDLFDTELV